MKTHPHISPLWKHGRITILLSAILIVQIYFLFFS